MKTIFISIFEGVEAKNLLRTDVVKTILENPDVRIVFFTKDQDRVEYYKKEFNDSRMLYEVVPTPKVVGFDRFFRFLKFQLLRTGTTDLRRRMVFEVKRNYFTYFLGIVFNRILARPFFIRLSRNLDFLLVKNSIYKSYFDKYRPDLVFCANLFEEPETNLLREAKHRGIKTVGFINSWDKPTARSIIRLIPDDLIVFNDELKEDLIRYDLFSEENIFVSGVPQYDRYFRNNFWKREEFFKKVDIDPNKKFIVYAPMGRTYSTSDWDIIDLLYGWKKEGKLAEDVEILVRFPPNDFIDQVELDKRLWLKYDQPGKLFSNRRGIDWDLNEWDLEYLKNTLHYLSVMICYASSISVDAAILDKPVININFEIRPNELLSKSPTQYYKMTHYQKALRTGGIRLAESPEKLLDWINRYMSNPGTDLNGRRRLVEEQCKYIDGGAGKRVGKFILKKI